MEGAPIGPAAVPPALGRTNLTPPARWGHSWGLRALLIARAAPNSYSISPPLPPRRADRDSLRARLSSLRQGGGGSDGEGSGGEGLQQLRSSSDNLRRLLERRAQRQQAQGGGTAAAPDEAPQAQAAPASALVPSGGGEAAPVRAGGAAVEAAGSGLRRLSKVRFWLKYRAEWGQRLKVVGTHENLGGWTLAAAPELKWSENDMWHATIELPAGGWRGRMWRGGCWWRAVAAQTRGRQGLALPPAAGRPTQGRPTLLLGSSSQGQLPRAAAGEASAAASHSTHMPAHPHAPASPRPAPAPPPQAAWSSTSTCCWTTRGSMPWPGSAATTACWPCATRTSLWRCLTTGAPRRAVQAVPRCATLCFLTVPHSVVP